MSRQRATVVPVPMPLWMGALLSALAYATASISGFFGMGGGLTLLALMTLFVPASTIIPLHGLIQLGSNSARTVAFRRHIQWRFLVMFAPGAWLGMALATQAFSGTNLGWFRPAIGVMILVLLLTRRVVPRFRKLPTWVFAGLGLLTGFVAIFVGATGPLIAPFFLRDDLEKEDIIATKAVCQWALHLAKIPAFLALGFDYRPLAGWVVLLLVAVTAGALTGKAILRRVSSERFAVAFQLMLVAIATLLIAQGLWSHAAS